MSPLHGLARAFSRARSRSNGPLLGTSLLLEYAAPLFPAEIVSGSAWVVRLQPPTGGGWVLELLSLVERWLESARLPCAKVLYGGRSYLIRNSLEVTRFRTATESPRGLSTEVSAS